MLNLKIEKGIPLPKKGGFLERTSELSQLTNLFSQMAEGDSIVISKKQANSLCSYVFHKQKQWSAPRRILPDGNYRVWKMKREGSS